MLYDEQARWRTTRFDSDSTTSTNRGYLSNSWASSIALSEGETVAISVEEGLKRAARPVDSIERMIEVKVSFDTDPDRAKADTRHWAALALTPGRRTAE
jgi:hypothetical protein